MLENVPFLISNSVLIYSFYLCLKEIYYNKPAFTRSIPFRSYNSLINGQQPFVIVDGAISTGIPNLLFNYSHSMGNLVPQHKKRDTSTEIAIAYLNDPDENMKRAIFVTNDHFDIDGLCGIFCFVFPIVAFKNQKLLIEIAKSGDFDRTDNELARCYSWALDKIIEETSIEFTNDNNAGDVQINNVDSYLYNELLSVLYKMLTLNNISLYKSYYSDEENKYNETEKLIENGNISIENISAFDVSVVTIRENCPSHFEDLSRKCIYNHISQYIVIFTKFSPELQRNFHILLFRYESAVEYQSEPKPAKRQNLTDLSFQFSNMEHEYADELNKETQCKWIYDDSKVWLTSLKMVPLNEKDHKNEGNQFLSLISERELVDHFCQFCGGEKEVLRRTTAWRK